MQKIKHALTRWWFIWALAAFLPVFILVTVYNERHVDYLNNGFFTFWLSGRFQISGAHPYSSTEWVNGHHANGATWIPNKIFPYPLPLALITAPLGLLSLKQAYILWDILAQLLISGSILWMASRFPKRNQQLFAGIILLFIVLNSNIYLGLMTGTFAALFLIFLILTLFYMENNHPFWAGVMLAGLALKPPLLIIAALFGLWLLFERNWKMLAGLAAGGLGLLAIGLIQDPQWVTKFLGAGENLFNLRLGNQPTLISYTRLFCSAEANCTTITYGLIALTLAAIFTFFIWKNHTRLSPEMAFSAAIALGVILPPYIWSYDYTLLIIPICFICFELIKRTQNYFYATLFLIALDVISFSGIVLFYLNPESSALTIQRDMWSIWAGIFVLACTCWIIFQTPKIKISSGN